MSKFDNSFTQKLRNWLDNENRDYAEGALLLFRLRGNQIEFRKISSDPDAYRNYIFNNIKKFYDFRMSGVDNEFVAGRVRKAIRVAKAADKDSSSGSEGIRSGKRADHDSLPENIQAMYFENRELMHRISDLHTKIRLLIGSKAECKNADLLPFAEELIRLDKIRLANWKTYDNYNVSAP